MNHGMRPMARIGSLLLCGGMGVGIAACGGNASSPTTGIAPTRTTTPPTATLDTTALPTFTPSGQFVEGGDPCTSPDAETANYLSANHIPLPTNTGVTTSGEGASDGVQQSADFRDANGCAANATPGQIAAFYQAQMPSAGWTASTDTQDLPCQGSPCWTKAESATLTVGITLQKVQAASNGATTFTLHIVNLNKNS